MNHLAHFFLAERSPEAVAGALLGDFVKGRIEAKNFPPVMRDEIIIHRRIDAFTDSDAHLLDARSRFVKTRRRLTGIVIDVAFDHFLAKNWANYSAESLDIFAAAAYRSLEAHAPRFPANFQAILPGIIADNFLAAYRDFSRVELALRRLSSRVRDGENLLEAFGELSVNYNHFEDLFRDFFPRLQKNVRETRKTL